MTLKRLLTVLGIGQRRKPRGLSPRTSILHIERLEDRSLLTAVANLVAYRPVTDYINYTQHPVLEAVESSPTSGPGIRMNGDDDNANGIPDYSDSVTAASGDNDLVRVDVQGTGTFFTLSWASPLAVWTTSTKSAPVSSSGALAAGQSVWVEYVGHDVTSPLTASLTLTVSDGSTPSVTDSVVFHRFQSVVIAIGGNSQDPRNFGDPLLGTFTMAGALYDQGYDVHIYSHDKIQSNGQGAAYNEVASAVLNRNIDYVAIFGYSWGGGATYELAAGLNNTAALKGQYQLQYTAYVDGIRHNSLSAETRLPVGTQYHDNFYQRKDWLLKGNSVAGANNVNVTQTSWGKSLVHTTIDDNATLQSLLVNKLMSKVLV